MLADASTRGTPRQTQTFMPQSARLITVERELVATLVQMATVLHRAFAAHTLMGR